MLLESLRDAFAGVHAEQFGIQNRIDRARVARLTLSRLRSASSGAVQASSLEGRSMFADNLRNSVARALRER